MSFMYMYQWWSTLNQHLRLLPLSLMVVIVLLSACSRVTHCVNTPLEQRSNKPSPSFNPLGDLLNQAQVALKSLEDPHPDAEASVRFILLHKTPLPDDKRSLAALTEVHFKITTKMLKSNGINSLVSSKLADRFQVATVSNATDLPISLDVLQSSLSRLKVTAEDFKGLTFVTYQGHALKSGLHLKATCAIAQKLSESDIFNQHSDLLIASLSTFEAFELPEFADRCKDDHYPWVRIVAELVGDQVRLLTRGLNQWGRPELEVGPIQKSQAPMAFPKLVKIVERLRLGPLFSSLTPLKSMAFHDCLRPEHHYDLSCRRIQFK